MDPAGKAVADTLVTGRQYYGGSGTKVPLKWATPVLSECTFASTVGCTPTALKWRFRHVREDEEDNRE